MHSPVLDIIQPYIRINKKDKTPIYLQIAHCLINLIHNGKLSPETKLPGTRSLSNKLYLHRQTIVAAYEELEAQGWIMIIPQKGTFVTSNTLKNNTIGKIHHLEKSSFAVTPNYVLDTPYPTTIKELFFTDGTPDFRLNSLKSINQIFNSIAYKKSTLAKLNQDFQQENENIKNQLINLTKITKGIQANQHQILCISNNAIAFHIILQTLLKPSDKLANVDWGNFEINMKLKHAQIEIITIPSDKDGINLEELKNILAKHDIKGLYIQTNQLYPSSQPLPEEKKIALLQLAEKNGFFIIEDDNDTDFVYSKTPPNTLQSLDKAGTVIYLNSLRNLLPAPYDLGYIIAPSNVIKELRKTKTTFQNSSIYLMEETVAEYIKEGLLLRQIQKNTKIYQKRKEHFAKLLDEYFEQSITYQKPNTGLSYWIQFNQTLPLLSIAKLCETQNLTISSYICYQKKDLTAMRLGFGHLNDAEAEQAIAMLSKAIYKYMYQ